MLIVFSRRDTPALSRTHIEVILQNCISSLNPNTTQLDFELVGNDLDQEDILVKVSGGSLSDKGVGYLIVRDTPFVPVSHALAEVYGKSGSLFQIPRHAELVHTLELEFVERNSWEFEPAVFYVARYVDIEGKYDYATVLSRFNEGRTFTAYGERMLLAIKHFVPIEDEDIQLTLSDMVYSASGVENSAHLQFYCVEHVADTLLYELDASAFNKKLQGVGLAFLVPPREDPLKEPAISISTIRTFKKHVTEFANDFVKLFGMGFDVENMEIYTIKDKYTVILAMSPTVLPKDYVINNLKGIEHAHNDQPSS